MARQTFLEVEVEVDGGADDTIETRRHRPVSELRFARAEAAPQGGACPRSMSDELRACLWEVVRAFLFELQTADAWSTRVGESALVRRVWTSPPIGAREDRIPEDVADVLEGWFSLVENADILAFLETVHDALEPARRARFAQACNAVLERGLSDHRFVLRRLMPIASKADIAALERAISGCKRIPGAEQRLTDALARLAAKPEPDRHGAIQEAVRAVELAAFALTGNHHLSLDDALDDLAAKGHVDRPLKAAYSGLFAYANRAARPATTDDARLIVVMCAGFVGQLAAKLA